MFQNLQEDEHSSSLQYFKAAPPTWGCIGLLAVLGKKWNCFKVLGEGLICTLMCSKALFGDWIRSTAQPFGYSSSSAMVIQCISCAPYDVIQLTIYLFNQTDQLVNMVCLRSPLFVPPHSGRGRTICSLCIDICTVSVHFIIFCPQTTRRRVIGA